MNNFFLNGFHKKAREKKELSPVQAAGLTGGAVGGLAGAKEMVSERLRDIKETSQKSKNAKTINQFIRKLAPGDIILTGAQKGSALDEGIRLENYSERILNSKNKLMKRLGKVKLPVNEHDLLHLVSGSPYYHAAIYTGKGNVINADGTKVRGEKLRGMIEGGKAKAYRFPDLGSEGAKKAVETAKSLKGREYKNISEQIGLGAKMLLDPTKGGKVCRKDGGRVVCTEVISRAYPEKFKSVVSAPDVRSAKGVEYVGSYNRRRIPLRHAFISKGISPFARAAKYALPASLAAGVGSMIYNKMKSNK